MSFEGCRRHWSGLLDHRRGEILTWKSIESQSSLLCHPRIAQLRISEREESSVNLCSDEFSSVSLWTRNRSDWNSLDGLERCFPLLARREDVKLTVHRTIRREVVSKPDMDHWDRGKGSSIESLCMRRVDMSHSSSVELMNEEWKMCVFPCARKRKSSLAQSLSTKKDSESSSLDQCLSVQVWSDLSRRSYQISSSQSSGWWMPGLQAATQSKLFEWAARDKSKDQSSREEFIVNGKREIHNVSVSVTVD